MLHMNEMFPRGDDDDDDAGNEQVGLKSNRTETVDDSNSYNRTCCTHDITIFCLNIWSIGRYFAIIMAVIWMLCLLIMIILPMSSVHEFIIKYIASDATAVWPADGSTVTQSCEFTWDNVKSHFTIYLFFHFGRYFMAAFIYRTRFILWTHSILFEVIEYVLLNEDVFRFNFIECWFDSVIFDICVCNALGIEIGLLCIRKIKLFTDYQSKFHEILFSKHCSDEYLVYKLLIAAACILLPLLEQELPFTVFMITLWFQGVSHWLVYWRTCFVYMVNFMYATNQVYYYVLQPHEVHQNETRFAQFKRLYFVFIILVLCLLELILTIKGYANL
eukprot:67668_1